MHKEEKIEEERKKKKEEASTGRGTSLEPIRRDRRVPVITNPPVAAYAPMNIRFHMPL